uniref:Malate dehydrogenase n=1 Tax=Clastoptera arizonana TaxID=38151 RepID=A0A1B6DR34_9HEMI
MCSIISSKLSNSIKNYFSIINQFAKYSSKKRYYSHGLKVAILGANGKIGQNVAMMLKQSSSVKEIALYDITNTEGLCMELNYIDTNTRVCSYTGHKTLKDALNHSNIVVIVAGLARRDGMTRFDLFDHNAEIISEFSSCSATVCPKAMLAIATNPVNSLVPVANEIYSKINKSNTGENIFGVTTLDGIRANTFVAEMLSEKPEKVFSPVIGGHSNNTIVPILSQTKPTSKFSTVILSFQFLFGYQI